MDYRDARMVEQMRLGVGGGKEQRAMRVASAASATHLPKRRAACQCIPRSLRGARARDARVAEQMRLGTGGKGRRAMRGRQRRQRRAAAKGARQRGIPEDVARRLGEANLLYASGECARLWTGQRCFACLVCGSLCGLLWTSTSTLCTWASICERAPHQRACFVSPLFRAVAPGRQER